MALEALAWAAYELFSPVSIPYKVVIDFVMKHWMAVQSTHVWAEEQGKATRAEILEVGLVDMDLLTAVSARSSVCFQRWQSACLLGMQRGTSHCKRARLRAQFNTCSPLSPRFSASPTTLRLLFRDCSVNGAVNASRRRRTFFSPTPGRAPSVSGEASTMAEKDCGAPVGNEGGDSRITMLVQRMSASAYPRGA